MTDMTDTTFWESALRPPFLAKGKSWFRRAYIDEEIPPSDALECRLLV